MSSYRTQILQRTSEALSDVIVEHPHLAPRLGVVSQMLAILAADADSLITSQLEQIAAMRALLRQTYALMPTPPALDASLTCEPSSPADYRVDLLDEYINNAQQALIEAQAWLESAPDVPGRKALLREFWSYLRLQAEEEGRFMQPMW